METQLWRASTPRAVASKFCFGDPMAPAAPRANARTPSSRASRAKPICIRRASYLRLGEARGSRQCDPLLSRHRRAPHRRSTRRSAGRRRTPFMPHPLGYPSSSISCAAFAPSAISRFRSRPIRGPSRKLFHRQRHRRVEVEIDAGATRAITQFFFDNDIYLRFLERARARGITIPIVPASCRSAFKLVAGFAPRPAPACRDGWRSFRRLEKRSRNHALVAATTTAEQVMDLVKSGVNEFSLLHQQPRRSCVRHLPFAGRAPDPREATA